MWHLNVPLDLIRARLPAQAKFIYIFLLGECHRKGNRVCSDRVKLAKALGLDRTTLRKHLNTLVQGGWLMLEEAGGRKTTFVIRNPFLEERQAELTRARRRIDRADNKGEAFMREWLNLTVDSDQYTDNARPGFLRNPATGEPLEYDRWYWAARVAFEFNGPQHYGPTDAFPDPDQARLTITRDYIKKAISQEQGIHLVTILPQDLSLERIQEKVRNLLPLKDVRHDDPVLMYLTATSRSYMRKARADRHLHSRQQDQAHPGE